MTRTTMLPSCVLSGKSVWVSGCAGPRFVPNIEKIEPWAMDPPGMKAGVKLAALTIERGAIIGGSCAQQAEIPPASAPIQKQWRIPVGVLSLYSIAIWRLGESPCRRGGGRAAQYV